MCAMPQRYSMGKRAKASERTRRQIETALIAALSSQPYEAITMAEIAQKADVSTRTLQRYYRSKDDLLLDACLRAPSQAMMEDLQNMQAVNAEDFIRRFVKVQFEFYGRHNAECSALHNRAAAAREVKHALDEAMEFRKSVIEQSLARWPDAWAIGRGPAKRTILALTSYRAWQAFTEFDGFSSAKATALATEMLCRHLLREGRGSRKQ